MSLTVRIDSHARLSKRAAKDAGLSLRDLRGAFEYENPDFHRTQRMGYWAGEVPRRISLLEVDGDGMAFPRGGWPRLRRILERHRVAYRVENATVSGTGPIPYRFEPPFELGPDQRMGVKMLVGRRQGILVGPCASGKTTMGIAAIARTGERALVIVHTERILVNWIEEAKECLGSSAFVGALYGKKKQPDADVVVATVQTLRRYLEKNPRFVERFGVVVLDEAHHAPATTFAETVSRFPALYRWALTATPRRKDGKEVLLYDAFGSQYGKNRRGREVPTPVVLVEILDEDLDRYGRIVPVDVVVVPTDFEFDLNLERKLEAEGWDRRPRQSAMAAAKEWANETGFDGDLGTYATMLDHMARDPARYARILEFLKPELAAGRPSILLADRREFCVDMQFRLGKAGVECGRMMGGKDRKEQAKTADRLNDGRILAAVGTTVADEGMNIKPLARGFGCTPTASNPGRLTQQFGRLKRKSPGKADAAYFYFWDRAVRGLRGHARAVLNAVKAPHRVWYAERPGRRNWRPMDAELVKELEREASRRFG